MFSPREAIKPLFFNPGYFVRRLCWLVVLLATCLVAGGFAYGQDKTSVKDKLPPAEYDALVDLFYSLDGPNWMGGWLNGDPAAGNWNRVTIEGAVIEKNLATGYWEVTSKGHVTKIDLSFLGPSGTLPSSLSSFTKLKWFIIHNQGVTGSIPPELGSLGELELLTLVGGFTGEIPDTLTHLTNLTGLEIYAPDLTGTLPASLGSLAKLKNLSISGAEITGPIPNSLAGLSDLQTLDLSSNQLTGSIPDFLGSLPSLLNLDLSRNNFEGAIPLSLGNLGAGGSLPVFIDIVLNCLDPGNASAVLAQLPVDSYFGYSPQSDCSPTDRPDLYSVFMEVVEDEVQSNEKITVRFQVQNDGPGDAEGYYVSFYLMANPSDVFTDREYIGKVWMPPLKAEENTSIQEVQFELPATIPSLGMRQAPNLFYVGMLVDSENSVDETDENDNYLLGEELGYDRVKIFGPPSIVMCEFDAHHKDHDGEGFVPGDTMVVDWCVMNAGYNDAEPFLLEFLFDAPVASELGPNYLGFVEFPAGLESGNDEVGTFSVDLPVNPSELYVPDGNDVHTVTPYIDPFDLGAPEFLDPFTFEEEVYGDHIVMMGVCADVTDPHVNVLDFYDNIQPGDQVLFEYSFKNASYVPVVEPFTVGVFLSKDPIIDPATDPLVYTKVIERVERNANHIVPAQVFNLPPASDPFWGALPQTYYLGLVIDLYEGMTDCDRSDNITTELGVGSFVVNPVVPRTVTVHGNPAAGAGSVQEPYAFKPRERVELDCLRGGRLQMKITDAQPIKLMEITLEKVSGSGTIYFTADGSPPSPSNYIGKLEIDPDDPGPYSFFLSSADGELRMTVDLPGGLEGGVLEVAQKLPSPPPAVSTVGPLSSTGKWNIATSNKVVAVAQEYYLEDGKPSGHGALYIFRWDGQKWDKHIVFPSLGQYDFGDSIATGGDKVVVSDTRRLYVYQWNGDDWDEDVITPSELNFKYKSSPLQGGLLSVYGDRIVMGLGSYFPPSPHGTSGYPGGVVIYDWNGSGWYERMLLANDGEIGDAFGVASLHGDTLAVGAPNRRDSDGYSGAVYLYDWDGSNWQQSTILKDDYLKVRGFGGSLSLFGDYLAVSIPGNNSNAGIVKLFTRSEAGWGEPSFIQPADSAIGDRFGFHLKLLGDRIIVQSLNRIYDFELEGDAWVDRSDQNIPQSIEFDRSLGEDLVVSEEGGIIVATSRQLDIGGYTGQIYNLEAEPETSPNPIDTLLQPYFTAEEISAGRLNLLYSDPDGDGEMTILELLTGSHPKDSGSVRPASEIKRVADTLQVDFYRHPDAAGLLALPMVSPNLRDWAQLDPAPVLEKTDPTTGVETWRSALPLDADTPDTFIRLFVEE